MRKVVSVKMSNIFVQTCFVSTGVWGNCREWRWGYDDQLHFVDNKNFEAAFLKFLNNLAFCIDKGRVSKTGELLKKGWFKIKCRAWYWCVECLCMSETMAEYDVWMRRPANASELSVIKCGKREWKGGIGGDCLKLVDSAGIVDVNGWYVKTGALRE